MHVVYYYAVLWCVVVVEIEERDKDKRRVLKKVLAENASKSKMKEKMLVRIRDVAFFVCCSCVCGLHCSDAVDCAPEGRPDCSVMFQQSSSKWFCQEDLWWNWPYSWLPQG